MTVHASDDLVSELLKEVEHPPLLTIRHVLSILAEKWANSRITGHNWAGPT
jgi:hypothetical protein